MVSLIDQLNFREKLRENPKVRVFIDFIENIKPNEHYEISSEIESLYINSIHSFISNDRKKFIDNYTDFSRRQPDQSAPFVRDDYLLFVLVCCVTKFSVESNWLDQVLTCRHCSIDECTQLINTFKNILSNDFQNKDNNMSISLLVYYLIHGAHLGKENAKVVFQYYTTKTFPFYKENKLNMVALRAVNIIIMEADVMESSKISFLKNFEMLFLKRVSLFSECIYFSLMFACIIWVVLSYGKYTKTKEMIDVLSAVVGVLGFAGLTLPSLFQKEFSVKIIVKLMKKLFGYKS